MGNLDYYIIEKHPKIQKMARGAETLLALKLAFRKAKKKKEGKLIVNELKELMMELIETDCKDRNLKPEIKERIEKLMTYVPDLLDFAVMMFMMSMADGPGTVSIDALVEYKTNQLKGKGGKDPKDKYKLLFRMLDTNKDETISSKELKAYFGKESGMEKGLLDEMLKAVEKNEDEKLNYADFSAILDKQK